MADDMIKRLNTPILDHHAIRQRQEQLAGRQDAKEVYEHLLSRIQRFQSELAEAEEVGIRLANFGIPAQLHIRVIGYKNPNLVEFGGVLEDGTEAILTQHISQLNFLLLALKPLGDDEPYRVGF